MILQKHHSQDHHFIAQIQNAMDLTNDDNAEYYPWKCPCGRISKNGLYSAPFATGPGLLACATGRSPRPTIGRMHHGKIGKAQVVLRAEPPATTMWMQSITKTSIQSTKTLWQRQTCWQREEQEQKGIEPRSRTTTRTGLTFPNRGARLCILALAGCIQIHADIRTCTKSVCISGDCFQQCGPGMGAAPVKGLPRPKHDARGHKVTDRKGRSREWTAWHQEFASSDQVPRKGQKAPRRGFRATEGASSAVDGSPCCRNPGVGGAIERLPQASDPAYRSGKSSPNRDQCDQQDHSTTQQPGSWWNCLSQSTGTVPHRGGRLDGGCC